MTKKWSGIPGVTEYDIRPLKYGGHCFYGRKLVTGSQVGEDFYDREIGGIAIPQEVVDRSLVVEVIGIGPRIEQPVTKFHRELFKRKKRYHMSDVKVGDILLCPDGHHAGIEDSPVAEYDYLLEEHIPLGIIEFDENEGGVEQVSVRTNKHSGEFD